MTKLSWWRAFRTGWKQETENPIYLLLWGFITGFAVHGLLVSWFV